MAQDRFMIAPLTTGLQTDIKPWLIPDDAFARLNNAYVFRGRVRKRFGSTLMNNTPANSVKQQSSRLRINEGTTNAISGNLSGTATGATWKVGQMFSIGDEMFTVKTAGAAVDMLQTGSTTTATFDTTNGAFVFVGAAVGTAVFFYPAEPVMGIMQYENGLLPNDEPTYAFDTQFSYQFASGAWSRLGTGTAGTWTGSDSQFMWGTNYRGANSDNNLLFVSNYKAADGIRYWNGTVWAELTPIVSSANRMRTARIVIPFKDRLLALNTIENAEGIASIGTTAASTGDLGSTVVASATADIGQQFLVGSTVFTVASAAPGAQAMTVTAFTTGTASTGTFNVTTGAVIITGNNQNPSTQVFYFPVSGGISSLKTYSNRCRFSQNGSPVDANSWVEAPGRGGFLEAPTKEEIISAEFIKDRLIVFFERSTWELAYTGNSILPFRWQKINTELGVESTFSRVPFDKVVLGVGNVGIHACNGANVERIDQKIDKDIFDFHNENEGVKRVQGIRDFTVEMVYWTLPSADNDTTFPDRVLIYDYITGSWAFNNDSITALGYFQNADDVIWSAVNKTWQQSIETWNSGTLQSQFRNVLAGNQEGYMFLVDPDTTRNAPALQITNFTFASNVATLTMIDHNLSIEDFIVVENAQGITSLNDTVYKVDTVVNSNSITVIENGGIAGTYTGGGTVARVSRIDIQTKQYNFYVEKGSNASVSKVDFFVSRTANGQVTVDASPSSSSANLTTDGTTSGALLGTNILETSPYNTTTIEGSSERLWHPIYLQAEGESVQLRIYLSDAQLKDTNIAWSDFQLNAMTFYAQPTSSRLQ